MTKLNNIDRDAAIAATKENLKARIVTRQARDVAKELAPAAMKRSASYCAYFATDAFAQQVVDNAIELDAFFSACDKTLNRYELFMKAIATGSFFERNSSDQNRYTFNIIRTMVNGHALKVAQISRDDISAAGSKRDNANDYVAVSSRFMSEPTVARQTGIALSVLEMLNVCDVQRVGRNIVGYKVNAKSHMFKHLAAMVKAENAAAAALTA